MVFKLVKIDYMYCDYLRNYDKRVVYNKGKKELRPFIGVLFSIGDKEYFAPLSSPKPKHQIMKNNIDFFKIDNGTLGVINFNNMIPVVESALLLIDIDAMEDSKYQRLLQNQYKCIKADREQIQLTAKRLRDTLFKKDEELNGNDKKIKERCCDLPLLEEVVKHYGNH